MNKMTRPCRDLQELTKDRRGWLRTYIEGRRKSVLINNMV